MGKLIVEGNDVYEIDEECVKQKEREKEEDFPLNKEVTFCNSMTLISMARFRCSFGGI